MFLTPITGHGLQKGSEVTVIKTNANGASSTNDMLSEIRYSGGTAYIWANDLSKTYIEPRWSEPRERKDISDALMNLVNGYRMQNGIRKYENPYVYYDVNNPGLGDILKSNGVRVAKRCCMEGTANHEGGQIGTGIYGRYTSPANASEIAQELFNNWKGSPQHNANMLYDHSAYEWVDVAVMTVVEWYDGSRYQYCAIMSMSVVEGPNLPEGLQ